MADQPSQGDIFGNFNSDNLREYLHCISRATSGLLDQIGGSNVQQPSISSVLISIFFTSGYFAANATSQGGRHLSSAMELNARLTQLPSAYMASQRSSGASDSVGLQVNNFKAAGQANCEWQSAPSH